MTASRKLYLHFAQRYQLARRDWLERYYAAALRDGRLAGLNRGPKTGLIVNLTTVPARLSEGAYLAIASLLHQSLRPDRVILWVTRELEGQPLPPLIVRLQEQGLEVEYCDDWGPHTKLVHALERYPDALLVTADDDCLYTSEWLQGLYRAYLAAPEQIHCWRAHRMVTGDDGTLLPYSDWDLMAPGRTGPSHHLFQTGTGGVLYPPRSLPPETLNRDVYRSICRTNDDIWFKAMALLAGTPVRKVKRKSRQFLTVTGSQSTYLWSVNCTENDVQLRRVFERYGLLDKLGGEF